MYGPEEQYDVDATGRKISVLLPLKRYQELMEDLHDLAVVAERREEELVCLAALKRKLKSDGVMR